MIQLYNTALARSTNFPYSSVSPSRTQPGPPRHAVLVHAAFVVDFVYSNCLFNSFFFLHNFFWRPALCWTTEPQGSSLNPTLTWLSISYFSQEHFSYTRRCELEICHSFELLSVNPVLKIFFYYVPYPYFLNGILFYSYYVRIHDQVWKTCI